MASYLIDTDWIIQVLRGDAFASATLENLAKQGLAISVITYAELFQGAWYARDPDVSLRSLREMLAGFDVIPFSEAEAERFAITRGQLTRNQRQQVGDMDLLIAATALHHGMTLVTFNRRDYVLVPDLTLY